MNLLQNAWVLAVLLVGCAEPQYRAAGPVSAQERALQVCQYEAQKATASTISGLEAGWNQGVLTRQCMTSKGYTQY